MATDELTIGPLHFEYDPKTRYLGIGNGEELYGTAEITVETWEGFVAAVEPDDDSDLPPYGISWVCGEGFRIKVSGKEFGPYDLSESDALAAARKEGAPLV